MYVLINSLRNLPHHGRGGIFLKTNRGASRTGVYFRLDTDLHILTEHERQKEEEKRRRKEEKEAAKRLKNRDEQGDLHKARAMDAMARERRKSFNAGGVSPMAFPTSVSPSGGYSNVYAPAPAPGTGGVYDRDRYNRERKYSNSGVGGLNQQFGDLDIDRERMEQVQYAERERKLSNSALGRPRKYSFNEQERLRKVSGNMGDRPTYAVPGAYSPATGGPYVNPRPYPAAGPPATYPMSGPPYPGASPNMRPSSPYAPGGTMATGYPAPSYPPPSPRPGDAYQRSTTPFGGPPGAGGTYPQGHILAGQPVGSVQQPIPRSRATTPIPGGAPGGYQPYPQSNMGASPRVPNAIAFPSDQSRLEAPQGFSRPINAAQSFTPFEAMKILEMDDILEHLPRMPLVLQTHDVLLEDWLRMTQVSLPTSNPPLVLNILVHRIYPLLGLVGFQYLETTGLRSALLLPPIYLIYGTGHSSKPGVSSSSSIKVANAELVNALGQ